MGLAIGTMVIFLIVGLLPIRGLKGLGIKLVLLLILGAAFYQLPNYWEPYWEAGFPLPDGALKERIGDTLGGGLLGPLGAILGLIAALVMAVVLRKKADE